MGYGNNPDHAELELTYNYGVERYDMGTAYGPSVARDLGNAIDRLQNRQGWLARCMQVMAMQGSVA